MDAEVLGIIKISSTVSGDNPPEMEIGDILHRRESEDGLPGGNEVVEGGAFQGDAKG